MLSVIWLPANCCLTGFVHYIYIEDGLSGHDLFRPPRWNFKHRVLIINGIFAPEIRHFHKVSTLFWRVNAMDFF